MVAVLEPAKCAEEQWIFPKMLNLFIRTYQFCTVGKYKTS